MMQAPRVNVEVRLDGPALRKPVDVRLRSFGERWIAVAVISGETQLGLGRNAREALHGALTSLGNRAATACLQDPALLAASVEIVRQERNVGTTRFPSAR
jgi:hypothetical protein